MLCARARAGFSSTAWRSELDAPLHISRVHLDDADGHVRIGEGGIEFEGSPGGRRGLPSGLGRRRHPSRRAKDVAIGERRPRRGEVGIDFERPLRVTEAEIDPLGRSAPR